MFAGQSEPYAYVIKTALLHLLALPFDINFSGGQLFRFATMSVLHAGRP